MAENIVMLKKLREKDRKGPQVGQRASGGHGSLVLPIARLHLLGFLFVQMSGAQWVRGGAV